jgi:molybdenum-dependent DNA-binding transcriptional regulator ModE
MLSWDDFRYVKAIAEARSLAGAAGSLGVNHSTVFRRLSQIEQQLGSRLFERGRAGYALTACGEQMVELADRMGEDIVSFERKVTGQDLRPSGELRVTTSDAPPRSSGDGALHTPQWIAARSAASCAGRMRSSDFDCGAAGAADAERHRDDLLEGRARACPRPHRRDAAADGSGARCRGRN